MTKEDMYIFRRLNYLMRCNENIQAFINKLSMAADAEFKMPFSVFERIKSESPSVTDEEINKLFQEGLLSKSSYSTPKCIFIDKVLATCEVA